MKGIVLAGGAGSCLPLLTAVTNKHLLPVGNYPMVFHPIAGLKQAGIKDTLVVTGRDHRGTSWNCWAAGMTSVWTSPRRCRTRQDAALIYAASDITGLTSHIEGLPCALLEAGASNFHCLAVR